jgi:hypothetical protein
MRAIAADYLIPLPATPAKSPLAEHVETFLTELEGRNCSRHTIAAYRLEFHPGDN